jgi:hypothetical protein
VSACYLQCRAAAVRALEGKSEGGGVPVLTTTTFICGTTKSPPPLPPSSSSQPNRRFSHTAAMHHIGSVAAHWEVGTRFGAPRHSVGPRKPGRLLVAIHRCIHIFVGLAPPAALDTADTAEDHQHHDPQADTSDNRQVVLVLVRGARARKSDATCPRAPPDLPCPPRPVHTSSCPFPQRSLASQSHVPRRR